MRTTPYNKLPSLSEWVADSRDPSYRPSRANDNVLTRIDNILDALDKARDGGAALYLKCDLYFAANFWLRNFKDPNNMIKMNPNREPAVRVLLQRGINELAVAFNCGVQALPNALEMYFGRSLSGHGRGLDQQDSSHYFLNRASLDKFKLYFDKGGRAWQLPWWKVMQKENVKIEPAGSAELNRVTNGVTKGGQKGLQEEWAFFVMSMSRDLYLAPHKGSMKAGSSYSGEVPKYHSSHLAGLPVLCSGSMLVDDGWIKGLRNDSGHYQPTNSHMVNVLEQLRMMRVDLANVDVIDYEGAVWANGVEFLANQGNWANLVDRARRNTPQMRQWEVEVKTKYKGGRGTDFRTLVEERYAALKADPKQGGYYDLWARAYREVAIALSEVDQSFWAKAGEKPFPPSVPSKDGRTATTGAKDDQSKFGQIKNAWETGSVWKK